LRASSGKDFLRGFTLKKRSVKKSGGQNAIGQLQFADYFFS
jgi:hypothetical protein